MMLKKTAYALPAFITAGIIFYFSSLENIALPLEAVSFNDLLFHAAAYFFFGLTLILAAYPWNASLNYPLRVYLILGTIGTLYGLSDEIHQFFVLNRTCSISDLFADSFGVIVALLGFRWWVKGYMRESG
ncbi:MAG: VanZ family protein [Thermodesulfobacteriota bacterium]